MLIARQGLANAFGLLSLLLSQSCILLYQSDGGGGASASAGAGNPGGGGAGGVAAGGAEVGGGGAGGGTAGGGGAGGDCAGATGDWLVDVGTFNNGAGEPGRLQSMVARPNSGSILLGGFSGTGFTSANGDAIMPNTFFLLEVGVEQGDLLEAKALPFVPPPNLGTEWTISLARRKDTVYAVLSNTSRLELMKYDGSEAAPLLTCTSATNNLKLGSLASNGDQLLLGLQFGQELNCTKPTNVTCPGITANKASTLLWPVEVTDDLDCMKHRLIAPQGAEDYFSAPRITLGPKDTNSRAQLLVTANGGPFSGTITHRLASGTVTETNIDDGFAQTLIGDHTEPSRPMIPAVFQGPAANAMDTALVGGAINGDAGNGHFLIARASSIDGTPPYDEGVFVTNTSSRLEALCANEDTLLAVGGFDQKAINELAVPGVTCGEPCAGWLAFDKDLKVVAHRVAKVPSVVPRSGSTKSRSGILVNQAVFWTGDSFEALEFGCDSLPVDDGQRHAFVARNALPVP